MKPKVCYISTIRGAHLVDAPDGAIVSILANGVVRTAQAISDLEVKVYYARLYHLLLQRRARHVRTHQN